MKIKRKLSLLTVLICTVLLFVDCIDFEPVEPAAFDETGATNALFSVSPTRQVRFARGNLQYQPSSGTFRLAEHQYDHIGAGNGDISHTTSSWLDLFGWGTSGWNSGAAANMPFATSTSSSDYYLGGDPNNGLYGSYAHADWGQYNPVHLGGNRAGLWRTLTADEWHYLLVERHNAGSKYGTATISGIHSGLIILPDTWVAPEGMRFSSGLYGWDNNRYTLDQWERMEIEGAVFLPLGGYRFGTNIHFASTAGYYHTATPANKGDIYALFFSSDTLAPATPQGRYLGLAIRLVQG